MNDNSSDSLLESLVFLTKYFQRPVSKATLMSGFALGKSGMSIENFMESSKRVGLITKLVVKGLAQISKKTLPVVLILKENQSCVLVDININEAKIILSDMIEGETTISIDELNKLYINQAIIIKPTYNFTNRISNNIAIDEPKKWFFGAMKRNISIYKKVIIAAVIINIFVLATPLFMKNVFDRVLPNNGIETLWAMTFGIVIIMIFDFLLKIIRSYYLGVASKKQI